MSVPASAAHNGADSPIAKDARMAANLPDVAKVETAIVEMTNAFRADHKLATVAVEPRLTRAARAYAQFLASRGLFSHTADGRQPHQRVEAAGYTYCETAENLALHQDSRGFEAPNLARKAVEGWMNSPGHRRNLLNDGVTEIGVAVAKAPDHDPKYIAVQLFGRPRSLAVVFQISNATGSAVGYTFAGKTEQITPRYSVTHTECRGGSITFSLPGGLFSAARQLGRYEARDGALYTLTAAPEGGIVVEVGRRETIKVPKPHAAASRPAAAASRASPARAEPAPATPGSSR